MYVHFVTRDYELLLQLHPVLAPTSSLRSMCRVFTRNRDYHSRSSESHDPAWGGYYLQARRAVEGVVSTVAICFATVHRLMYKMARKSNERKAVSSGGSRGNSLLRTVIYRCWTIHEERALMRTAAALFIQTLPLTPVKVLDRDRFNLIALSFDRKDTRNTLLCPIIQHSSKNIAKILNCCSLNKQVTVSWIYKH